MEILMADWLEGSCA